MVPPSTMITKMKRFLYVALSAVLSLMVVAAPAFSGETRWAEAAVTCNPIELSPCLAAVMSSTPPSETCCSRLREQTPCFCGYLNDPSLRQFADNPIIRTVGNACGVAYPQC
ncbi:hypothetical protein ES332_A05G299100v1 [Gossypium tomentosum]|nr:hypothetical protein ES332_A05G299100v1 [Gossypium tomentosum]